MVQSYSVCSIFSFIIFLHFLPGSHEIYFNCDPVNEAHYCLCTLGESGSSFLIECPARMLELYPISLKLTISPLDPEEASLRIICDPNKAHFAWRLVQGLDFENGNITFTVTSLEISYCPPISTADLQNFLYQMKLDPEDIHSFSYQTWRENVTFPLDFLQTFKNLELVDLRNNKLSSLPRFEDLKYLVNLNLRGNNLNDIPNGTFSGNPNLEQIRLGGNLLTQLNLAIFPSSLIFLDLVDNRITTITNDSLANLDRLQVLYLNNNPLEHVEIGAFMNLKNLTELSLDYSKLFSLPMLKHLPKLANLSISYSLFSSSTLITSTLSPDGLDMTTESETENTNYYTSTTPFADNGSQLISGDEIMARNEDLPLGGNEEELIGDLFALKKLILINDDLQSLSWLGYLPSLTDLVLSKNQLRSIPDGIFRNTPRLMHADISQNSISELSEIDAPLISYLDLSNNFVRILDQHYFKHLKLLRVLILSTNKIEYIHPKTFENLESLTILDLSNNKISFETTTPTLLARQSGFGQYDMMTTIMSTTEIPTTSYESVEGEKYEIHQQNQSPLQYLTRVERVNLRNNLIKKIFMDWTFAPMKLKSLDLSYNKIRSLHPRDLYFVSQDVRLDLRHNHIKDIDMDFAELLLEPLENKNIVVLLDGNPLHCDCQAIAFKKFNVRSYHLQYSDLRCASPDYLEGRKFAEVPAKDLKCILAEPCPQECSCWELPSESLIKMDCNGLNFLSSEEKLSLKNLSDIYEPLEFEMDLSSKKVVTINESSMKGLISQIRLINLTQSSLRSIDFLSSVPPTNNQTKFALSLNQFTCGCKFQKIWWKNFRRIVDIHNVTCILMKDDDTNSTEIMTFQELVRSRVCTEDTIADEIRYVLIIVAILSIVLIAVIICVTKLYKERHLSKKASNLHRISNFQGFRSEPVTIGTQPRNYAPTRSKVVDMDNSKF